MSETVLAGAVERAVDEAGFDTAHLVDWLPHADWVELDGVGHCPQRDVPLETAELILGFTT